MGLCKKIALGVVLLAVAGPLIYRYRDQREYNLRTTADEAANGVDLSGKVIIVTGANTVCTRGQSTKLEYSKRNIQCTRCTCNIT